MPRKKSPAAGHRPPDNHAEHAGQRDHAESAIQLTRVTPAGDLQPIIDEIRYWHRQRCYAMEQRKRSDLALGSFLRVQLGWSLSLSEDERSAIAKQAAALIDEPDGSEWKPLIEGTMNARQPFADIEKRALDAMRGLAESLPIWKSFAENIRGFGPASLAVIVAEAGDLSAYSNPAKVWKRMGLAVMDGVRQGGLPKGSGAEEWIAHGYNRQRRSRMWNIGDAIIKGNQDGDYRRIYLERKAYELKRDPDMKPIKAHRRAQRYMEKRLLKNLWQAWRRAEHNLKPCSETPVAGAAESPVQPKKTVSRQPKRSATPTMKTRNSVPSKRRTRLLLSTTTPLSGAQITEIT